MKKKALITGITGQDGSYLAEFLLDKGYEVHGIVRRASTFNRERIRHLFPDIHNKENKITLHYGDLGDSSSLNRIVRAVQPDEIYHLGAQSVAEECLCPILSAQKMEYRTLGNLWEEQVKKNKKIRVGKFNNTKIEMINLSRNTQLKALAMWNGMGTWFPIRQISRHRWKGKMAKMSQKFGSVIVTPNHSILDVNGKTRMPKENPWLLNIRKLNYKPNRYIENIRLNLDGVYKSDKNYFWLDEKGAVSKISKIITKKNLKSFCRFIGAFVAKGHTTFNKANGNWYVGISSGDKKWLGGIETDLKTFYKGKCWHIKHEKKRFKDLWELQIKSRALYNLCGKLSGENSKTKQLPYWFSQIKNEYLIEIWEKMLEGDGNIDKKSGFRYTTASYKLACQLSWLFTVLGSDYTVHEETNKLHGTWHFRECKTYQPDQEGNDRRIKWIDYDGWVYDITVDEAHNFTIGVGNIVVHNSHVGISFEIPEFTGDITALGTIRFLEAIRNNSPKSKFYQASSSEIFGLAQETPQKETTPFHPRSPYGVSKVYAYWATVNYRESYGLFACNGILFNHESPRRGENFVTRKITLGLAQIIAGKMDRLYLGNLDAKRDWGFAGDFVHAMWLMLQKDKPDDFVIATGENHSVREFLEEACRLVGMDIKWEGNGVNEKGVDAKSGRTIVEIDPRYLRPAEVDALLGDARKAKEKLGWTPKTHFKELVRMMMDEDLERFGVRRSVYSL